MKPLNKTQHEIIVELQAELAKLTAELAKAHEEIRSLRVLFGIMDTVDPEITRRKP